MNSFMRRLSTATFNLNLPKSVNAIKRNSTSVTTSGSTNNQTQFRSSRFCSGAPNVNLQTAPCLGNEETTADRGESEADDVLYKRLEVEVRGHDAAVLKSYEWFATTAAKNLGIAVSKTWVPQVDKYRRRALKSAFAHGKHIVQYEFRTYFRVMELVRLTGSTADTYLEYIQRNLPEGVAMKVTKERIEKIPSHFRPPNEANRDGTK